MEATEVLVGKQIHRAGLNGGARCGAEGRVRLSYSGVLLMITCPECRKLDQPNICEWCDKPSLGRFCSLNCGHQFSAQHAYNATHAAALPDAALKPTGRVHRMGAGYIDIPEVSA